jgi:hypothetical protein
MINARKRELSREKVRSGLERTNKEVGPCRCCADVFNDSHVDTRLFEKIRAA